MRDLVEYKNTNTFEMIYMRYSTRCYENNSLRLLTVFAKNTRIWNKLLIGKININ